jgi:hypothetical protein
MRAKPEYWPTNDVGVTSTPGIDERQVSLFAQEKYLPLTSPDTDF